VDDAALLGQVTGRTNRATHTNNTPRGHTNHRGHQHTDRTGFHHAFTLIDSFRKKHGGWPVAASEATPNTETPCLPLPKDDQQAAIGTSWPAGV